MTTVTNLVEYHASDGVARITLSDGDRGNPISAALGRQLLGAVRRAHADSARVIVLAARGRFFSVGGDLAALHAAAAPGAFMDDLTSDLHRVVVELMESDAVVVSAVQGHAAGAGFPLACAADIVLAARTASFSLAYARVGLSPDGGSTLLTRSLGLHTVLRLALLGQQLTAQEALDAGLVAQLVSLDKLPDTVEEVVATLLDGSAEALGATKAVIRGTASEHVESVLRREAVAIRRLAGTDDGREGVRAFLEKRSPSFG